MTLWGFCGLKLTRWGDLVAGRPSGGSFFSQMKGGGAQGLGCCAFWHDARPRAHKEGRGIFRAGVNIVTGDLFRNGKGGAVRGKPPKV